MTELEACVLALICRQGPMNAYQVRREFERSPASSWRASTGSIYPLIKRLSAQGLLEMDRTVSDGRGTKSLQPTEAGKAQVRLWLTEWPAEIADVAEDPIRTRIQFFNLLDGAERARAAGQMGVATDHAIARMKAFIGTLAAGSIDRLAHEGALAMLVARRNWLIRVQAHCEAEEG